MVRARWWLSSSASRVGHILDGPGIRSTSVAYDLWLRSARCGTRTPTAATMTDARVSGIDRRNEALGPYVPRLAVEWLRETPECVVA